MIFSLRTETDGRVGYRPENRLSQNGADFSEFTLWLQGKRLVL
jgi:hypothetical protein